MIRRVTLALSLTTLLVACGSAQAAPQGPRVFTPNDVARIQMVRAAHIHPSGEQVAYEVSVQRDPIDDKDGAARTELHVLRADGTSRRYVGNTKQSVSGAHWTPAGDAISFLTKRAGDDKTALYTIPLDGGEAERVLSHAEGVGTYAWHPDGKQVAFLAKDAMDKAQKKLRDKGFNANVYEEAVRPRGVWIGALGSDEARRLDLKGSASSITWSPEGDRLAVALAPTALIDDYYMHSRVSIVRAKDGKVLGRVQNPGKLGKVTWSPDGTHLALVSARSINDPSAGRLMIVQATGGEPREVPIAENGAVHQAIWTDDSTLVYVASEGTATLLGRVSADGSDHEVLHRGDAAHYTSLSLSKDTTRAALVANTPSSPSNVYTWTVGADAPQKRSTLNPWLADVRLGNQRVVRYPSRDGAEIEGILIEPVGKAAKRPAPTIIMVHGGPESHYRNGWLTWYSSPGQVAAGRGFAVFYPNYRGSTGRGVAFSRVTQGDPAGIEFDDIVDGADHLVAERIAKKGHIGITGGSYGGFASAWGATYYTDRFAASVVFVGVTDLVSKVGTTDIPQEMYRVHYAETWPWEKWDMVLKRSPIYHADKSKTPTLILHGEEDPRVDPGQGRELYRHLKLRGQAPVRLVTYPGEGHGNRRAASRLDYNLRMLRWMDHYLKGAGGEPPAHPVDPEAALGKKTDKEKK